MRAAHERWDGRGYPDRLAGEDIPLGARILLACDAYGAMTLGPPVPPGAAPPRTRRPSCGASSGSQLDPRVVDALIETLHAGS